MGEDPNRTLAPVKSAARRWSLSVWRHPQRASGYVTARQRSPSSSSRPTQLENDRMTELTKDLRDTQSRMLEFIPKLTLVAALGRIEIWSPYSGARYRTQRGMSVCCDRDDRAKD
jgi:hypothetical protein